ncbi:hypothetical protein [Sporosarcina sp. 6E9]|uniref:hypothetical protein n=1 Tax=Sporosarcina sp. 6E9 TaxID=2819235 RepID=UPI001B314400|nr:hypothetical protein [Sporosarcina sp. 6E9]
MDQKLFKTGVIIKVVGVIVIVWGFMQGVAYLPEYVRDFGMMGLTTIFAPMVSGLLIYGFGEVIDLLQQLVDKGKPKEEEHSVVVPSVPFYAESEIKDYYKEKKIEIGAIQLTNKSDIFSVEVDGKTEYVELTGFKPKVLSEEEVEKLN